MKFRAVLEDSASIKQFVYVVSTVARLAKVCTLRIAVDSLCFIVLEPGSGTGATGAVPGLWCHVQPSALFGRYDVEPGPDLPGGHIGLEVRTDSLALALAAAGSRGGAVCAVRVALARRLTPCLSVQLRQEGGGGGGRLVTHHVPVTVVPRRLSALLVEPRMPHFHVGVQLPPVRVLRSVTERMRRLAGRVTVMASEGTPGEGARLVLRAASQGVSVATHFEGLRTVPPLICSSSAAANSSVHSAADGDGEEGVTKASVMVDVKPLAMFLSGDQAQFGKAVCNVIDEHMLHLLLIHDHLTMQYFIPGVVEH